MSSSSLEPDYSVLARSPRRWLLATRPAFLTLTLAGAGLGVAAAGPAAIVHWPLALCALALAVICHAAVNVINDVADHDNGGDAANQSRLYPFTGGSRFIQQKVLTRRQMAALAGLLFAAAIGCGLALAWRGGPWLLAIGLAGVTLGWGYSAPPLRLNSRGLGEAAVLACVALLPLGAQTLLAGRPDWHLLWLAAPLGLLAAALLYINQFPDREADILAGKRHWVARLPLAVAWRGYGLLAALAYLLLLLGPSVGGMPASAALGLLAAPLSVFAALSLRRHAAEPSCLRPAIVATIAAVNLLPCLLIAALLVG
nr:prenyltransferase [Chromobacterium sp. ASV5]